MMMEQIVNDKDGAGESSQSHEVSLKKGGAERLEKLDPLTLDLVLEEVFRNLPSKDLAQCRLVSRQWYEESTPAFRDTATLLLKEGEIIMSRYREYRDDNLVKTASLEKFLKYWEACAEKPFSRFELRHSYRDCWERPFWVQVGSYISHLTLSYDKFSLDEFWEVIYQLCPNMKSLELSSCYVEDTNLQSKAYPEQVFKEPVFGEHRHLTSVRIKASDYEDSLLLLNLLGHFSPSLNSIKLDFSHYFYPPIVETRNFLLAVRTVKMECQKKLPLKDCYFEWLERSNTPESAEIFQLLLDLHIPLHNLKIWLNEGRELLGPFRDILCDHSQTIERLDVEYNRPLPCLQFPFGAMLPKLVKLEINDIGFCNDFHFLRSMPNLTHLRLPRISNARGLEVFANTLDKKMADVRLLKMKNLLLCCAMTEYDLRRLQKWMPNVEVAALNLDNRKLYLVCENWRKLRGLHDIGNELTDAGLLGISEDGEEEEEGTLPKLTDLKCLKYFGSQSRHLTMQSVTDGLLNMSSLKTVFFHSESPLIQSGGGEVLDWEKGTYVDTEYRRNPVSRGFFFGLIVDSSDE